MDSLASTRTCFTPGSGGAVTVRYAGAQQRRVMVNVQPGWMYTLADSTVENLGAERAGRGHAQLGRRGVRAGSGGDRDLKVVSTFVGGRVVYEAPGTAR